MIHKKNFLSHKIEFLKSKSNPTKILTTYTTEININYKFTFIKALSKKDLLLID